MEFVRRCFRVDQELLKKNEFLLSVADDQKKRIIELRKQIRELTSGKTCFNCCKIDNETLILHEFCEELKDVEGYRSYFYCDNCKPEYINELHLHFKYLSKESQKEL